MFLIMGLCFGLSALGLLGGAVWFFFKQRRSMESRVAAMGTVVDLVSTPSRRSYILCPMVEFTVPAGQTIRFTSDFGSRPASHQVGQSVHVRYDPLDPQKAEIESTMNTWLVPGILVFMGAIAFCLFVVFVAVFVLGQSSISP